MLTLTKKPKELDNYTVVSFDLNLRIGEVGSVRIYLHSRESGKESDLQILQGLKGVLGEDVHGEYEGWSFVGRIFEMAFVDSINALRITVVDALSKLAEGYKSQVFSEQKLGDIVSGFMPGGQAFEISSGFDKNEIKMAIQYQESDLDFLKRLVGRYGGQIWCAGDTIYVGAASTSAPTALNLEIDIVDYTIQAGLGPEQVQMEPMPYRNEASTKSKVEISGAKYGDLQESIKEQRKKKQVDVSFHTILEDTTYDDPRFYGQRFLRSQAGGRLSIIGTLSKPVHLGSCIKIVDAKGKEESLVIRTLRATARFDTTSHFYFEASAPDALILDAAALKMGLQVSTAIVKNADDPEKLNRVRVGFPWDQNRGETPWLRVASPYWGDEHMYYIPPKIDDAVLVIWGQEDLDPIVLGSLSIGHSIDESSETFVLKTTDGQTITIGKKNIKIANEADGGSSVIELEPNKIVMNSESIELSSKNNIKLDTSQMDLSSKQAEFASDQLKLKSKQGSFESQMLELQAKKLDVK
jgi:hypothetical protein